MVADVDQVYCGDPFAMCTLQMNAGSPCCIPETSMVLYVTDALQRNAYKCVQIFSRFCASGRRNPEAPRWLHALSAAPRGSAGSLLRCFPSTAADSSAPQHLRANNLFVKMFIRTYVSTGFWPLVRGEEKSKPPSCHAEASLGP